MSSEVLSRNLKWQENKRPIFRRYQFYRKLRQIYFMMDTNGRDYPPYLIHKINDVLCPLLIAENHKAALDLANEIEQEWLKWKYTK